ncbi:MAG: hypothetical protein ABIU86_15410 [Gemmatimonadaceae bacterium]
MFSVDDRVHSTTRLSAYVSASIFFFCQMPNAASVLGADLLASSDPAWLDVTPQHERA